MKTQKIFIIPVAIAVVCGLGYVNTPPKHEPVIGDVDLHSEASQLGFFAGDRIETLNSKPVSSWEDFKRELKYVRSNQIQIGVIRDGTPASIDFEADPRVQKEIGGLSHLSKAPVLLLQTESPLKRHGIKSGDLLLSVEQKPIRYWREINFALYQIDPGTTLNIEVFSASAKKKLSVSVEPLGQHYSATSLGIENPDLYVLALRDSSIGVKLGLQKGDRLLAIQGQPVSENFQWSKFQSELETQKKLVVEILRGPEVKQLMLPYSTSELPQKFVGDSETLVAIHGILGIDNWAIYRVSNATKEKHFRFWLGEI